MTKRLSMKSSSTRIHQPPPETRFRTYQLDMFQVSSFTSNSKGSTRQPLDFHRRFRRPAEMRNGMHKSWSHENFERLTCITGGHRAVKYHLWAAHWYTLQGGIYFLTTCPHFQAAAGVRTRTVHGVPTVKFSSFFVKNGG